MHLSKIYYLHEVGAKPNQEDYIWPVGGTATLQNSVFIVCDGVGGSENGEVASRVIAESLGKALLKCDTETMSADLMNKLLSDSQQEMVSYCSIHGLSRDMATTLTVLILLDNKAFVAWCGDSRIYHIRNGEILYQSSDHSLVNSLVKNGEITEEEAFNHPKKNIILRAVRADLEPVEVDCDWILDIAGGDYFMLCTDGLLENITNNDLGSLLVENDKGNIDIVQTFQQFCLNKTRDNYSMYLLKTKEQVRSNKYRPRILLLAAILLLLVLGSIFLIKAFYHNKSQDKTSSNVKSSAKHSVVKHKRDSVFYNEPTIFDDRRGYVIVDWLWCSYCQTGVIT